MTNKTDDVKPVRAWAIVRDYEKFVNPTRIVETKDRAFMEANCSLMTRVVEVLITPIESKEPVSKNYGGFPSPWGGDTRPEIPPPPVSPEKLKSCPSCGREPYFYPCRCQLQNAFRPEPVSPIAEEKAFKDKNIHAYEVDTLTQEAERLNSKIKSDAMEIERLKEFIIQKNQKIDKLIIGNARLESQIERAREALK